MKRLFASLQGIGSGSMKCGQLCSIQAEVWKLWLRLSWLQKKLPTDSCHGEAAPQWDI